jgi:CRP-like cAMP-binding protein
MLSVSYTPKQNCLLAALPSSDYERLLPTLELLPLPLGLGIHEAGSTQSGVYFPTDSIISLVYVMANGLPTEVAMIGNDGLVGISLFMGGETAPNRAVVRNAGYAYRLEVSALKKEIGNGGPFRNLLLLYTQSLMTQIAQNSACTRHHTIEQRLCRWLLMSFDLLPSNQLMTTHAQIANMLGVRRELVTTTAGILQKDKLIRYSRGHITALDRPKLEMRVCECYAAIKREADRLIQQKSPDTSLARKHFPPSRKSGVLCA